jgi:hypothetical protein
VADVAGGHWLREINTNDKIGITPKADCSCVFTCLDILTVARSPRLHRANASIGMPPITQDLFEGHISMQRRFAGLRCSYSMVGFETFEIHLLSTLFVSLFEICVPFGALKPTF